MPINKYLTLSLFTLFSLILAGCSLIQPATRPVQPEPAPAAESSPAPQAAPATVPAARQSVPEALAEALKQPPPDRLSGPLLYDILLGEIAGQRQQLGISVAHYLHAAETSQDPQVAERAMRIALYAKNEGAALEAARRWVELDPDRLEARQSLAALALRAGRRDEALVQLRYLIDHAGNSEQVFNTVTAMLAGDADRQAALATMQQLVKDLPQSPAARFALSRMAAHAENYPLALEAVDQALALKPDWEQALVHRARVRIKLGQTQQAAEELARAIKAYPKAAELRLVYAGLLLEQQQVDKAIKQFKRLLVIDPENDGALYSMGLLSIDAGDLAQAEEYFRKLLSVGKREQEAYYYLGRIAEEQKDFAAAKAWYEQLTQGQYVFDAQMRIARIKAEQGDLEAARRQLQSLRLANPKLAPRLYLFEGDLLIKADDLQAALALYNRALSELPDNRDILYARGLLHEKLDDITAAEADFKQILQQQPDHADTLNALGYTLADRTDRLQEALAYIQRAHELKPDEPAILDSLGWVYYRLGEYDQAIDYLKQAWEKFRDSEVAAHLGEALWQAGQHAEARRIWQEGQQVNPDNPVLKRTLERFNP